ncbi:hypothetical protein SG34_011930 [Thalassomonas viridans]|uniref:Uncharacterized protein n=1 Tax=Thalassomonas viridans TaxID=137584 RepID=A0AAE9Z690_9GAMM|nr:hypothetical protein [Thalassomonas viridans]WDE07521.1 hypothetical protein SG34_011930 [Thalassomonas viridans]
MDHGQNQIEIPFDCRHLCWFCGEPAGHAFTFPNSRQSLVTCVHQPVTLPACDECRKLAAKANKTSIWAVAEAVKSELIRRYHKDLAIGVNWTQESLAQSGFEGGNFAGFQKSAWFMYQVARGRVNFQGWPLVVNGVELVDEPEQEAFTFDGITYPSLTDAINHYCQIFHLDKQYFISVLQVYTRKRFAEAVRFCRLTLADTPKERAVMLKSLKAAVEAEVE